jgi:DNA polymerase alpha-associated DNA helicase A
LDALTRNSEQGEIVSDVRREMDELLGKLKIGGKGRLKGRARVDGWDQVRHLRGEYKRREQKCVTEIVKGSKACVLLGFTY